MKFLHSLVRISFILSATLLLASCASPQAIVRMKPLSPDVRWNYGQAFAADTLTGIIVETAFDKATNEYTIFDVKVVNGSNLDYLVDPENFTIEEVTDQATYAKVYKAIDPETMILSIDKQNSKAQADAQNAKVATGVALGVFSAATVALALTDDHPHYRRPQADLLLAAPLMMEMSNNDVPQNYESEADQQRNMWETLTIRKTTLASGYRIDGKIFFPRIEKPGTYLFKLKVDQYYIEIPFTQTNVFP